MRQCSDMKSASTTEECCLPMEPSSPEANKCPFHQKRRKGGLNLEETPNENKRSAYSATADKHYAFRVSALGHHPSPELKRVFTRPSADKHLSSCRMKILSAALLLLLSSRSYSQAEKIKLSALGGYMIVGYANRGGFLNFLGPSLTYSTEHSKFALGMLPSLRLKKDKGLTKNSFITPGLGLGFTYSYKIWSFQVPIYYNPKTSTENGKWHVGIGLGFRLDKIKRKE